jgi:dTDP-4-dehydrorhamnose reductase
VSARVLITGSAGQVGRALLASMPADVDARGVDYTDFDITDAEQVRAFVTQFQPQIIIHAAAYTAVDKAENDSQTAHRVNADGARNFAQAALTCGARLLHISTDFVFDGRASRPYLPGDAAGPLSVYGATKLASEQAVLSVMADKALVVRTAWVYAALGNNFVRTMLRVMNERGAVRVIADQVGTPTAAASLAEVLWKFAFRPDLSGIYHWTDAGVASWYDFAVAIAEEAAARGMLSREVTVTPIATTEYPTPAARPAYSVLDKRATYEALGLQPIHWRVKLRSVIEEIAVA